MAAHQGCCNRLPMKKALSGRRSTLWKKGLRGSWETPHTRCNKTKSCFQVELLWSRRTKGMATLINNLFFYNTSNPPLQQTSTSRRWHTERRLWWRTPALWMQATGSHTVKGVNVLKIRQLQLWGKDYDSGLIFSVIAPPSHSLGTKSGGWGSATDLQSTSPGHSLVSI